MTKERDFFLAAFGRRLRVARKALDLQQGEVADLLGISTEAYRSYENGWARMPIDLAAKLPGIFHRSLLYFFGMEDAAAALTEEEAAILQGYRAIRSPDARRIVQKIIEQEARLAVSCQGDGR